MSREPSSRDDPVARQYARWPYPDPELGPGRRRPWHDPSQHHLLYWPRGAPPPPWDILVAGCGTTEAVDLALRNPAARVLGIDVSLPALERQRELARRHGARNLELLELPIERAEELDRRFHLVTAGGVLHHLAEPVEGLRALGRVLRPEGVLVAAVYREHPRLGVAMLQEVFRRTGLSDDPQGLALGRALLASLPPHHPLRAWMEWTGEDGRRDAHFVDTFLPARERRYTVRGVLELVRDAGLAFQGWFENAPYHPETLLEQEHPYYLRLASLPDEELWELMELLDPRPDHAFLACRPERPREDYAVDWEDPGFLSWVPVPRLPPGEARPRVPHDPRDPVQDAFWRCVDGRRDVAAVLADARLEAEPEDLHAFAREMLRYLWRKDAIYLYRPRPSSS